MARLATLRGRTIAIEVPEFGIMSVRERDTVGEFLNHQIAGECRKPARAIADPKLVSGGLVAHEEIKVPGPEIEEQGMRWVSAVG